MRTKKVPIFLEFMKKSFLIISLILFIYTIGQLITFWMFTDEYERDLIKDQYMQINKLAQGINIEMSENAFHEYLQQLIKNDESEAIRIYSADKMYYESKDDIWRGINIYYEDTSIKYKFFDSDTYMLLTAPINISGSQYIVQIVRENDMFQEFIENSFPILIFTLILAVILSAIGAIYVSKNFINRLRRLITTMNEI